jgi:hypothetical protein
MTNTIENTINKFPVREVFTAHDFPETAKNPKGISKILNDLVAEGVLRKLSKGRFYKPQIGKSGELPLDTYQTVTDLLEKGGKVIGYLTGY